VVRIRLPSHGPPFEAVRCLKDGWSTVMRTRRKRHPILCRACLHLLR
jgi:hypothetical protein